MAENLVDLTQFYNGKSQSRYDKMSKGYSDFFKEEINTASNIANREEFEFMYNLEKLRDSLEEQETKVFKFLLGSNVVSNNSKENMVLFRKKINNVMTKETRDDLLKINSAGLNNISLGEYIQHIITDTGYEKITELDESYISSIEKIIKDIFESYNFADGEDIGKIKGEKIIKQRMKKDEIKEIPISKKNYQASIAGTITPWIYKFLNDGNKMVEKLTLNACTDLLKQVLKTGDISENLYSSYKSSSKDKPVYFLSDEYDFNTDDLPLYTREKKTQSMNPLIDLLDNLDGKRDFDKPKDAVQLEAWRKKPAYNQLKKEVIIRINVALKDWIFSVNGLNLNSNTAKIFFDKLIKQHRTFFISRSSSKIIGNLGELYSLAIFSELLGEEAQDKLMSAGSLSYGGLAGDFKKGKEISADMFIKYAAEAEPGRQNIGVQIKHFFSNELNRRTLELVPSKTIPDLFTQDLANANYPYEDMQSTLAAYLVNEKASRGTDFESYLNLGIEMDRFFSYFAKSILDISLISETREDLMTAKNVGNLFYLYELNYFIPASSIIQSIIDNLKELNNSTYRLIHASNTTDLTKKVNKTKIGLTDKEIKDTNLINLATVSLNFTFIKEKIAQFNILEEV